MCDSERVKGGSVGGGGVVGGHGSASEHRWRQITDARKELVMSPRISPRSLFLAGLAVLAFAIPAAASAAQHGGALVFSQTRTVEGVEEGGLFAVHDGRQNQLTENPADSEPSFSPDGRTIAFAREGDVYTVRPDGSGERRLTNGSAIDSRPQVSPNGQIVLFERRSAEGRPANLYTVRVGGGPATDLTPGPEEASEARFAPDGKTIVFVRTTIAGGSRVDADLYSIRPGGSGLTRLTTTGRVDEFDPRYFAGGIVFSRGNQSAGPAGYADVYTMKANGTRVKPLVQGVGSAYVEDVSPQGHTLIFRRDRGLWVKKIGPGKAKKVAELPDGSQTNSVFSSDGRSVATLIEIREGQRLMAINLANGRKSDLAEAYGDEGEEAFGPVIDWQPVR
ncbi:MAG: PD40 domain-containing protein [Actinobacteria bacterium]|nr:PD40 domain-containing protein [Actinomycetota bacterium]